MLSETVWLCSKIYAAILHWQFTGTDQWRYADADRCHFGRHRWPSRRQLRAPVRCSPASLAHMAVSQSSLASSPVAGEVHDRVYAWRRTRGATWRRCRTCWCGRRLPAACWAQQSPRTTSVTDSQRRMNSAAAPETGSTPAQQVYHTLLNYVHCATKTLR